MTTKKNISSKPKDKFNLQDIKDLIAILRRNNIWEFNLEQNGIKIHVVTGQSSKAREGDESRENSSQRTIAATHYTPMVSLTPPAGSGIHYHAPPPMTTTEPPSGPKPLEETGVHAQQEEIPDNLIIIKSPMVGTFYRAPAPDAPPYVEVSDVIKEDTVLCIIEAMKLMNELKSECTGRIAKILVENGQPVEYGQHLFLIEPL